MFHFYTQNGSFDPIRPVLSITAVPLFNLMKVILNSGILQNVLLTTLLINDETRNYQLLLNVPTINDNDNINYTRMTFLLSSK